MCAKINPCAIDVGFSELARSLLCEVSCLSLSGHSCKAKKGSRSSTNCIAFTRVSFTTHSLARSLRSLARSIGLV